MDPTGLLAGIVLGGVFVAAASAVGLDRERGAAPIALIAIAAFYPVFALMGAPIETVVLHCVVFVLFAAVALLGYVRSARLVAVEIIAHGAFDIVAGALGAPGPEWWPAFCAAIDVIIGGWLLYRSPAVRGARVV